MAGKRASVLHNWMGLIDMYTMSRALTNLTQEEFDWEPHPGAWGVRRREACKTPNPSGEAGSAWVSDNDWELKASADRGEALEPMTTIGWLLNHFGAAPGLTADLDFLGGSTVPTTMSTPECGARRTFRPSMSPSPDSRKAGLH